MPGNLIRLGVAVIDDDDDDDDDGGGGGGGGGKKYKLNNLFIYLFFREEKYEKNMGDG